jgi:hypothetical protein
MRAIPTSRSLPAWSTCARLVGQLEEHHAPPLFATLRAVAPCSVPAMRANYVDRLAGAVLWLAEQLGNADLARREVPALVALADPNAQAGLLEVEHDGRRGVFLRRGGCCLNTGCRAGRSATRAACVRSRSASRCCGGTSKVETSPDGGSRLAGRRGDSRYGGRGRSAPA